MMYVRLLLFRCIKINLHKRILIILHTWPENSRRARQAFASCSACSIQQWPRVRAKSPVAWYAGLEVRLEVIKRVLEAPDEVVRVLNADGDADEAVRDANLEAVLREHVGVGHDGA